MPAVGKPYGGGTRIARLVGGAVGKVNNTIQVKELGGFKEHRGGTEKGTQKMGCA